MVKQYHFLESKSLPDRSLMHASANPCCLITVISELEPERCVNFPFRIAVAEGAMRGGKLPRNQ